MAPEIKHTPVWAAAALVGLLSACGDSANGSTLQQNELSALSEDVLGGPELPQNYLARVASGEEVLKQATHDNRVNPATFAVEVALTNAGFGSGHQSSGVFNSNVKALVESFQEWNNAEVEEQDLDPSLKLTVDGKVGSATLEAIKVVCGLPAITCFGDDAVLAAAVKVLSDSESFAYTNAPVSLNPALTANGIPGETKLQWLTDQNKCNHFVLDALDEAGFAVPTVKIPVADGGGVHYLNAEKLPHAPEYFDRVTNLRSVRPGDVLVVDYAGSGVNTAHTEIITSCSDSSIAFASTGYHINGAYETDGLCRFFLNATYNADKECWENSSDTVRNSTGESYYILRPVRLEADYLDKRESLHERARALGI